jgi:hypothetical protein
VGLAKVISRAPNGSWGADFSDQPITDLSALREQNINVLSVSRTKVHDLTPLAGMPLSDLRLNSTKVSDLSPLKGAPITTLNLFESDVEDVSPLIGMPLKTLTLSKTRVTRLEPLRTLPLTALHLDLCKPGIDLSPLADIQSLRALTLPPKPRHLEALRKLPHLEYLSYEWNDEANRPAQTVEEFWASVVPNKAG